jgi:amino acid adenylation domain-containing protein
MASKPEAINERIAGLSPEKRILLERLLKKDAANAAPPRIGRRPVESEVPLSFAQQRIWFFEQLMPGTTVYNMPLPLRLKIPVNHAALHKSINEIVRRHEALRTTFQTLDGKPLQVVSPALNLELPLIDLRGHSEEERETELARLMAEDDATPFDLTAGPLLRARLVRMDLQDYALLIGMHHIVSDSWSIGIFFQEFSALYAAFASGQPSPLPELPIQYGDFAVWQRNWLQGEVLQQQLAYWKNNLEGIAPIDLPCDRPRPSTPSFRGGNVPLTVGFELVSKLRALAAQQECTLFMVMLAAFQVLLGRYTDRDDVVVGTPVANRNHAEIEGLIGFFINSLVMRTDLSGNPSFREALARLREIALGAYANQDVPFEILVERLQPERDLTRNPLFQVLFQLQSAGKASSGAGASVALPRDNAIFELNANLWELSDSIAGTLEYNADLFDEATVSRMTGHFGVLLQAIADDPGIGIGDLPILTEPERRQLLDDWNANRQEYPKHQTIVQLFEEQVARTPAAPAVAMDEESLTYSELNERADRLASRLRESGAGVSDRIGICLERSVDSVVAILGVLKSGAAYVPFDPEYPPDRLRFLLDDSGVRAVVTQTSLLDRLPDPLPEIVAMDRDEQPRARERAGESADTAASSDDTAYIVYTSGSTGTPKGVAVPHGCLSHSTWARLLYYREPVKRFLLLSPFSFDSSIAGIFWTLVSGGCLEIAGNEALASPLELAIDVERKHVTHLLSVPSLYTHLLDSFEFGAPELKVAIVAGEACPSTLVRLHFDALPHVALFNEYGPTEASVWATVFECRPDEAHRTPPIGRPIPNARTYIVDRNLQPVPVGVPGELWIGGEGVARGYWNRPDLTAERFIDDPFTGGGARVYRTGDRARYLPGGDIEFLGRMDEQVKVRGYRIELGEIEAALLAHPAVAECAAFVWKHVDDARLAACAVARGEPVESEELIDFLRQRLPDYMVPPSIAWVASLPRNVNGKLDRAALSANPEQPGGRVEYIAPRTPIEEVIAALYSELLGVQQIGIHDNFYRLGGHSLLATQLLSRVNKAFQLQLPLPLMFEADTVASLAEVVEQNLVDEIAGLPDSEVDRLVNRQGQSA